MQVQKTIETPEGRVSFEGELTQAEADLVIKVGLSALIQAGLLTVSLSPDLDEETPTVQ